MNQGDNPLVQVKHNRVEQRFEAKVEGRVCVVDYTPREGGIAFTHTYVPPELRGRGIAEKLVRAALEYARDERLRVTPECSYVETFIQRHREFAPLVA
jgi:uncharacterized protein